MPPASALGDCVQAMSLPLLGTKASLEVVLWVAGLLAQRPGLHGAALIWVPSLAPAASLLWLQRAGRLETPSL